MMQDKLISWRSDIEGLRAIAILPVMLFHYDETFLTGGFLGVDLFFVISGFLITKLLITNQYYTTLDGIILFLKRRFLRIFPTLVVWFPLFIIIFSLFVNKSFLESFYLTPIFSLLGLSNIYLAFKKITYFSPSSNLNPFLHSWSISLEDQFYIFYVFTLFKLNHTKALSHFTINKFSVTFFAICALFFMFYGPAYSNSSFYLPYARIFEFLLGGVMLIVPIKNLKTSIYNLFHITSIIIIFSFYIFKSKTTITNIDYLIFIFSASTLLLTNNSYYSFTQIFLGNKIFRYIGRLSFSLYVIHFPLLKLLEYISDTNITNTVPLFVYFISTLALSMLNYRFIETVWINKYRHKQNYVSISKKHLVFKPILLSIATIIIVKNSYDLLNLTKEKNNHLSPPVVQSFINTKNVDTLVVLGDSHAQQLFSAFKLLHQTESINILNMTGAACFLSEDLIYISEENVFENRCKSHIQKTIKDIIDKKHKKPILFMGMRSLAYLSPMLISKNDKPIKGLITNNNVFIKNEKNLLIDIYFESLSQTMKKLEDNNVKVIFMAPIPELETPTSHCILNSNKKSCNIQKKKNEDYRDYFMKRLNTLKNQYSNLQILDLFYDICTGNTCSNIVDGKIIYRDDDHLSNEMALRLSGRIKETISKTRNMTIARNKLLSQITNLPN
jgi:peptidoglycan/LPS O-acetylase OafA/YrhL